MIKKLSIHVEADKGSFSVEAHDVESSFNAWMSERPWIGGVVGDILGALPELIHAHLYPDSEEEPPTEAEAAAAPPEAGDVTH